MIIANYYTQSGIYMAVLQTCALLEGFFFIYAQHMILVYNFLIYNFALLVICTLYHVTWIITHYSTSGEGNA